MRHACRIVVSCLLSLALAPAGQAWAFGGAMPPGPAVAPVATEEGRPIAGSTGWVIGTGWAWTASSLRFDKAGDIALDQQSVFASAERGVAGGWSLRLGAAALVRGTLNGANATTTGEFALTKGWALGISASRPFVQQKGKRPWVRGMAGITYGHANAEFPGVAFGTLSSWDFRAGASVGWRVLDGIDLYAVGRGFLGPVTWSTKTQSDSGADRGHVQFGAGVVAQLYEFLALHLEASPVGERGVVIGASLAL